MSSYFCCLPMLKHFQSLGEFSSFACANRFQDSDKKVFHYSKNLLEKLGDLLVAPVLRTADWTIQHLKYPLVIVTLVVVSLIAARILCIPVPFLRVITPATLNLGLRSLSLATVVGLFLRTWGRLSPQGDLMRAWRTRDATYTRVVDPIPLGTTTRN